MKFGVIIPVLNAMPWVQRQVEAIHAQSAKPSKIIVIDSSSTDGSDQVYRDAGFEVISIDRSDFDHGGTRQFGISKLSDCDFAILLTQDAIPADAHAFERILSAFADAQVGVVYGRQLPREGSGAIEAHARLFNYPDQSRRDDKSSLASRGVRAGFCSNSFSAYRLKALEAIGGMPVNCIFGEDAIVSIRLMQAGWSKYYSADAQVFHSHSYGVAEEFRRSFDVGVLHASASEMNVGGAGTDKEGFAFVSSELKYLSKRAPLLIPAALVRTCVKYSGYKLGKSFDKLPKNMLPLVSLNRRFWLRSPAR